MYALIFMIFATTSHFLFIIFLFYTTIPTPDALALIARASIEHRARPEAKYIALCPPHGLRVN
jgi:hypothetical protein